MPDRSTDPVAKRKAFLLRIDPAVHDALRRWADDELRSLNAQIEILLREALQRAHRLKDSEEKPTMDHRRDPDTLD